MYHFVCLLLVVVGSRSVSSGSQAVFAVVVCTGFVATVLEPSPTQGAAFAVLALFTTQSLANGFMFSKIVSEI